MSIPYRFQSKCYARMEEFNGRALLSLEMGLGKTPISCFWARRNPEARPIIVICPASLRWNWQNEIRIHMKCDSQILEGMTPYPITKDIIIIGYPTLHGWLDVLKS